MKKLNKSTGITLIALIITVIVMIILVGVTVNVALNGGLFDTAKQAASGMEMAQIRERAEVVKANLFAEAQSNNSIILSKTELKNRLLQEFEGSTAEGDKVIVEDGKYDIIIKNTDLDIEVVEHSDNQYNTEPASIVGLDYTTSNIEADGELCVIKVSINLTRLMSSAQYVELRAKEDASKGEITAEEKEQITLEYISEIYGMQFNSIDEAVLYDINSWYGKNYTTLEECLQDETVQLEWGSTKEQLYYTWCWWMIPTEGNEYTKDELIDFWYNDSINNKYYNEFNKYTRNLSLYIENDGKQELLKNSIILNDEKITIDYAIGKNGKYEFVVKTNTGEEITREVMQINNIISPNPYVLTEEEAEGIWETDGKGTITKYTGQDKDVLIPAIIGTELITKTGYKAFYGNTIITNVIMTDALNEIGASSFAYCSSLENILISDGVKYIRRYAFNACQNLTAIVIPDNVTVLNSGAFDYCINLSNVTLSKNLTTININTFYRCYSLESIIIPSGVKTIDNGAFWSCTSLTEIVIPEGVTTINHHVFKNCKSLKTITLPNSVTSLDIAFEESPELININFAAGDNPIPDGQPWGAPNENLVVTKLTE